MMTWRTPTCCCHNTFVVVVINCYYQDSSERRDVLDQTLTTFAIYVRICGACTHTANVYHKRDKRARKPQKGWGSLVHNNPSFTTQVM